jgi:hypothetical protein
MGKCSPPIWSEMINHLTRDLRFPRSGIVQTSIFPAIMSSCMSCGVGLICSSSCLPTFHIQKPRFEYNWLITKLKIEQTGKHMIVTLNSWIDDLQDLCAMQTISKTIIYLIALSHIKYYQSNSQIWPIQVSNFASEHFQIEK